MAKPLGLSKYQQKKNSGIVKRNWVSGQSKFEPTAQPGDYHRDDTNPRNYAGNFQQSFFVPRPRRY